MTDNGNRVDVTGTTGGRRSRLIALAVVAVLAGVIYVGLSGRQHNVPEPTPPQVSNAPTVPPATPSPNVSIEVPAGYRTATAGEYAAVLEVGQGAAFVAVLDEPEPGQLVAHFQIALHGSAAKVSLSLVQFSDALLVDATLIEAWNLSLAPPDRGVGSILDSTAGPAIGMAGMPRLIQAGYRVRATLGPAQNGVSDLAINVTAGRVDILHPQEVYEIRLIVSGLNLPAPMYQLELGHLQASETWPADAPRRFHFQLVLIESAGTTLSNPVVVGKWPLHVRGAKRVPGDGLTLLDKDGAQHNGISILASTGYHVTVTETVDPAGIHLTFDVYAHLGATRARETGLGTGLTR